MPNNELPHAEHSAPDHMPEIIEDIIRTLGADYTSTADPDAATPFNTIDATGGLFLHRRNPSFHSSREVETVVAYLRAGGQSIANSPAEKNAAYLGLLANQAYVNDGILTGDEANITAQVEAHVIKAENISESYFDQQRRLAREQGYGDIKITDSMRREAARIISADQRHSLRQWAEYLAGTNAGYPDWFKTYAFDGITKLSKFDEEKGEFQRRSNSTVAPYPEVNRGALSRVYSWLKRANIDGKPVRGIHGDPNSEDYDPEKEKAFQGALASGRFDRLYAAAIEAVGNGRITAEQRQELAGSWRTYPRNSNPEGLYDDLQGYGLDWCIATGYETAANYLKSGDLHIYYSTWEDEDVVPRIAIRMEGDRIAEVRGIDPKQELEASVADIASERLQDTPGGDEYIQRAQDMKLLTALDEKVKANPDVELTLEEVRFLYEVDRDISKGFGYGADKDPRIGEIRRLRDSDEEGWFPASKDEAAICQAIRESINDQFEDAVVAYGTTLDQLGRQHRASADVLRELFSKKAEEWQKNGVYDLLAQELRMGKSYTLVVTPNISIGLQEILVLAEEFGKGQTGVHISKPFLERTHSNEEWSGNTGDEPIRLSLMPNDFTMMGSADSLRQRLHDMQTKNPSLGYHVPSPLEAIAHWHALRLRGETLKHSTEADAKTRIGHFNLSQVQPDGGELILESYVDGGVMLGWRNDRFACHSRVAIG